MRFVFYRRSPVVALTVRNLPDEVHRALKVRAALNNRSTEAEVRAILVEATRAGKSAQFGTMLSDISREMGLTNADFDALELVREKRPAEPVDLS
jgi:plasmid stability protein